MINSNPTILSEILCVKKSEQAFLTLLSSQSRSILLTQPPRLKSHIYPIDILYIASQRKEYLHSFSLLLVVLTFESSTEGVLSEIC